MRYSVLLTPHMFAAIPFVGTVFSKMVMPSVVLTLYAAGIVLLTKAMPYLPW